MDEPFNEPVAPSDYSRQRREAWLTRLRANADMASAATMQAHGESDDRRAVQSGQQGLFPNMSPQDRGADNALRPATVGAAWGNERPLLRLGGTLDPADVGCAPAPARVDLRFVNQPAGPPTQESGLARWLKENR